MIDKGMIYIGTACPEGKHISEEGKMCFQGNVLGRGNFIRKMFRGYYISCDNGPKSHKITADHFTYLSTNVLARRPAVTAADESRLTSAW